MCLNCPVSAVFSKAFYNVEMAGQPFRFWSHIDTARGRGRGRRHCGWPNAQLQAETLPEVFVEGGVSGGHPVPEGSVELCRESEASYYKNSLQ